MITNLIQRVNQLIVMIGLISVVLLILIPIFYLCLVFWDIVRVVGLGGISQIADKIVRFIAGLL